MRILKPFISKSFDTENPVVSPRSTETSTSPTNAPSKDNTCSIVLNEAFKKRQKTHWKQYNKEHKEQLKELIELAREHKEVLRKQRREKRQRKHWTYFDPQIIYKDGVSGDSSPCLAGRATFPGCPADKWQQTALHEKLSARRSMWSFDSGSSSFSTASDGKRSMFDSGSKLSLRKIRLRPATRVKNKFTEYRAAFSSSSFSSQKLHKEEDIVPELHRTTSQTSLETITAVQKPQIESTNVQSCSSGSSSSTEYEDSNSTSNTANVSIDELTQSFSSLETQSLTDYSLHSEQSSISSAYSFSSLPPSLSAPSNDLPHGDDLNSELSSINQDFIEFNQRFEVMHNLNPTIPIRHQRLAALNAALPERLDSMTASLSTFSTRSELEFSDVETYQTERNDDGDENDNVRIMVRGEEQD